MKYDTAKFMNRTNDKILPITFQKLYKIKTCNTNQCYRIKVKTVIKAFFFTNSDQQLLNITNKKSIILYFVIYIYIYSTLLSI